MTQNKAVLWLHRTLLVLLCLALITVLMQGVSWLNQRHRQAQNVQLTALAHSLAHQMSYLLAPLMISDTPDKAHITPLLKRLTEERSILDATVYDEQGNKVVHAGGESQILKRLAMNGKKPSTVSSQQIVEPITVKEMPVGYLRLTLDMVAEPTEATKMVNITHLLQMMVLLALVIGVVLARTLRREKTSPLRPPYDA